MIPSRVRGRLSHGPCTPPPPRHGPDPTRARRAAPWRLLHARCTRASTGSERDDEPSARATRLQPAVGLSGALRGVGGRHAQGDGTRLHELPEAVQCLERAVICAHRGRCKPDAPLGRADETPHRREGATVADGGNYLVVKDGAVGEPVDAVREVRQHPRGHIVAVAHDDSSPSALTRAWSAAEASAMTVNPSALATCTT